MAEYYPLLARAVASLPDSTPDARRAIFDRARNALLGQLRAAQPPVPTEDIDRESLALDEAIARLEAELAAKAPALKPPALKPPVLRASAPPVAPGAANVAPPRPAALVPPPPPPPSFRPAPRPLAPGPLMGKDAVLTSTRPVAPAMPIATTQSPGASAPSASVLSDLNTDANSATAAGAVVSGAQAGGDDKVAPFWRRFGKSRAIANGPARTAPAALIVARDAPEPVKERVAEAPVVETFRPAAPIAGAPRKSRAGALLLGLTLAIVVGGMAVLAYRMRDNPADFAGVRPPPAVDANVPAGGPKSVERIGGGARPEASAELPTNATPETLKPPEPPPVQRQRTETPAAELPVGQRAALLMEAPEESAGVKTWYGTVIWKLERPASGGLPVLRAEVDIPEARLMMALTITRNADPKAPSTHILTILFTPGVDSQVAGVAEIVTPSMRIEDRPSGDQLEGRPVLVTVNYFLVGLIGNQVLTARNLELMRSRSWFDVPMKLSTGKIAKITFEKGTTGERLLAEAMAEWQKK